MGLAKGISSTTVGVGSLFNVGVDRFLCGRRYMGGAKLQFSRRVPFSIPIGKVTLRLEWYRFPVPSSYAGGTSSEEKFFFDGLVPFWHTRSMPATSTNC